VGDLKPTTISLQLVDRSVKYPMSILEDVPLQVGKFFIPCNFIAGEIEEGSRIPIILGRPFLATAGAMIDVKNGKISVQVGNEKVEFSLPQSMSCPTTDDSCCKVDILERTLNQEAKTFHSVEDPLEVALIGCHVTDSHSMEKEEYARLLNESTAYAHRKFPKEVISVEELSSKEEEKSASKVELKPLPSHLRHKFLDPNHKFPIIVSSKLDGPQLKKLLDVLRKHKGAIRYSTDNIKGLSPSLYMYHIFLDEGHRSSRQPQRD